MHINFASGNGSGYILEVEIYVWERFMLVKMESQKHKLSVNAKNM